ncbi:MAG: tyrosine-type recombinase/integrase [Gemmataceae bacterium]|nr:tyrosine-type recombinase/integrase [Gemmataceae bacterium]
MNLQQLIERYITYRQTLGERFRTNATILRAFGRALGPRADVADVRAEQVDAFLAGSGSITSAWHIKHNALAGFYRYATSRGYVARTPLPAIVPQRPPPFVPYIYSQAELRRLVQATESYQRNRSCMEPITMRTIVLLLYGTGLRVREAVALDCTDVDLGNAVLTVRRTKFFKTRLVPFGPQLGQALRRYLRGRPTPTPALGAAAPFFTTRSGTRVNQNTIESCFRRVRERAGVGRSDGARYQPRLHDLRHTFAVHRLTSWYRQGADVQKLLPQLSVYLGHVHLAATQVYLRMTPELLAEANARFERYAGEEAGHE